MMLKDNLPSTKEHLIQLVMVFVVYAIAALFLFKSLVGFFPWEIQLALSGSLKTAIIFKIIIIIAAGTIGSFIGSKLWNRHSGKK